MATPTKLRAEKYPANASTSEDSTLTNSKNDVVDERLKDQNVDHIEDGGKPAQYEKYLNAGLCEDDARFLISFSKKEERAIYRKVDWRVVPVLSILYLISHLDRANIGLSSNAKIEGLEDSLGMSGADYKIAVSIFFIPYILCEVPSNIILAKFSKPSQHIGILVTAWGTIVTLSGLVQNLAGLCVVRFLIGLFEAGFFPGAVWLISQWYPPYKTQSRTALFYLSSAASGAFSGLLAAGIAQLDDAAGLRGWRWIFILEGIISIAFGSEIRYLNLIHYATRGTGAGKASSAVANPESKKRFNWKIIRQVVTDRNLYLQAVVFASNTIPNNGMKFTMPQIISNMGYKSTNAQLLSAPPYIAGAIAAVVSSLWADRRSHCMPLIVFFQSLGLISMGCIGMYPIIPANQAWTVNNLARPEKRVSGIAFMVTLGNTGAFVGSWIFQESERPEYPTGFGTCLAIAAVGIAAALTLEWLYDHHSKRWRCYSKEQILDMYGDEQLKEMGGRSPLFKYGL